MEELSVNKEPGAAYAFIDEEEESVKDIKVEKEDLKLRQLYGKVRFIDEIKVSPDRAYSLTVHPHKEKCVVAMGDKRGAIGM